MISIQRTREVIGVLVFDPLKKGVNSGLDVPKAVHRRSGPKGRQMMVPSLERKDGKGRRTKAAR